MLDGTRVALFSRVNNKVEAEETGKRKDVGMRTATALKEETLKSVGVLVFRERRITSSEHCPTCDSRRKSWVDSLGWVCTACFERYQEVAEQVVDVGSGVARMRQAYELAIHSYQQARNEALW